MTRWLWLLAVPYVIVTSSDITCEHWEPINHKGLTIGEKCTKQVVKWNYKIPFTKDWGFNCDEQTKDACYDIVDALNQAHELRTSGCYVLPDDVVRRSSATFGRYDNMIPVDRKQ